MSIKQRGLQQWRAAGKQQTSSGCNIVMMIWRQMASLGNNVLKIHTEYMF